MNMASLHFCLGESARPILFFCLVPTVNRSFCHIIFFLTLFTSHITLAQDVITLSANTQVKDLNSKTFQFSELAKANEGVMIVSFWATWCKPCIQELNNLSDLYDELVEDYNVTVYAISIDDARTAKKLLPFINGKGWEFEVYRDENSDLKRRLGVVNIPHTFIIDQNNQVVYEHTSYVVGDEYEYLEVVEGLNE